MTTQFGVPSAHHSCEVLLCIHVLQELRWGFWKMLQFACYCCWHPWNCYSEIRIHKSCESSRTQCSSWYLHDLGVWGSSRTCERIWGEMREGIQFQWPISHTFTCFMSQHTSCNDRSAPILTAAQSAAVQFMIDNLQPAVYLAEGIAQMAPPCSNIGLLSCPTLGTIPPKRQFRRLPGPGTHWSWMLVVSSSTN